MRTIDKRIYDFFGVIKISDPDDALRTRENRGRDNNINNPFYYLYRGISHVQYDDVEFYSKNHFSPIKSEPSLEIVLKVSDKEEGDSQRLNLTLYDLINERKIYENYWIGHYEKDVFQIDKCSSPDPATILKEIIEFKEEERELDHYKFLKVDILPSEAIKDHYHSLIKNPDQDKLINCGTNVDFVDLIPDQYEGWLDRSNNMAIRIKDHYFNTRIKEIYQRNSCAMTIEFIYIIILIYILDQWIN